MKVLQPEFNRNDPELISAIDDLPLWSAPFGMALLEMVHYRSGMKALDVGCGLGFPMLELAQRLGESCFVYGIDPWDGALERVTFKIKKLGISNAAVVKGTAEQLPFEGAFFDLIVSNNGLNNVKNLGTALAECFRVCRPGGQLAATMNLPDTMKEFYDVFRATLKDAGKTLEIEKLDQHIYEKRKPLRETMDLMTRTGFVVSQIREDSFTMRFLDGTAMLNHFLIKLAFLGPWKDVLGRADIPMIFSELERRLNEQAVKHGDLRLTIPFVCFDYGKP